MQQSRVTSSDDPLAAWMRGLANETPVVTEVDARAMYARTRVRALIEDRRREATKLGRATFLLQIAGVVAAGVCLSFAWPTLAALQPGKPTLLWQGHTYPVWLAVLVCLAAVLPWLLRREVGE